MRKASLLPFVFVMYAYTTGGPFGLEDQITLSGPGLTLLSLLAVPFFWCVPVSLAVAEMTTALPREGGAYVWVREALGPFWGFQAGWWSWVSAFVLSGAYAVLTVDYLSFYLPWLVGWKHYTAAALIVAIVAWINVRGIRMAGAVSTALGIAVLLAVLALSVAAAPRWRQNPFLPFIAPHAPMFQVFGMGMAVALWLYSGYEQVSSVAEEVENPRRNYPMALAIVVPLSIATYFLPAMFSLAALGDWQKWHTGYFSTAGRLIGGPWLGFAITFAAMLTNLALFNATVLTSTRLPSAMSQHGDLPKLLTRRHPRYGTPWIAIVVSSLAAVLLVIHTLTQLLTIYVWLRIGVTILTVLAAWRLRRTRPELPRSYRIPWGGAGIAYVLVAPLAMSALALSASDPFARRWGLAAMALGPLLYVIAWMTKNRFRNTASGL
jgi:amino acid transporter